MDPASAGMTAFKQAAASARTLAAPVVIPAQAGIQYAERALSKKVERPEPLDSRLRGNDEGGWTAPPRE